MDTGEGYTYIARIKRDELTGEIILFPIEDSRIVDLNDGDRFVTIQTVVDLFEEGEGNV